MRPTNFNDHLGMVQKSCKPFIIAVDGTSGAGKGTLSKQLAAHYHLAHLDTGNIYRAVALKILTLGIDLQDPEQCCKVAQGFTFADTLATGLREEQVAQAASVIGSYPSVRLALLEFQRNFAANPPSRQGAVLDGRDIGTVVCPDALCKIYLTANLEVCALRRYKQLQEQQIPSIYDRILHEMQERDQRDRQRAVAPSKPAPDAYFLDSTDLDADQVFERARAFVDQRMKETGCFQGDL